ncbi:aminopeptidase [Abyssisolibacter fermentans]|uniref:aminopeptidase n=1 Tax=Abyssisolibacter fermentans TaxID=1766203 RepID=UPI000837147F|nr:aminopeptidase [Abyssisolibacter fermentans]
MMDSRIAKLAENLVNYSTKVKKDEKVLIEAKGASTYPLVRALIKEVYKAGGYPFTYLEDGAIFREIALECNEEQLKFKAEMKLLKMKNMDVYIGIGGSDNINELSDVDSEKIELILKCDKPVRDCRVDNTKWVVLRYPNASMVQAANTSLESFEEFYFNVCIMDYEKMSKAMDNLVELMNRTDKVHIKGEGTDLTFSIKGIPVVKCDGQLNIPDGEVYTAPIKDSVNGKLSYNCPAVYQGFTYENICLEFKDGKIVKATANDTERINKVFDTDEGARYVGEFAIGVNPYVTKPMKDTLFDEKIMGSFHFTPGRAYEKAPNGNNSAIHWDLVCIQTPEYGGGEIYFDDVLIRKDGKFVVPELECLNPENLK